MNELDVCFAGVAGQAELLAAGTLSAPDLLEICLRRISRLDGDLHAFRTVLLDSARREAAAAQQARDAGDDRPLLGVPVAVKDNADLAGEPTGHGTRSPEPAARRDSEVVRRLRQAGLVVLGRTAMPELALFPFTESPATGLTRNPWDRSRTPGGSSGGSAVAVAAGMVAAATASDGGGSIRIPAACCGLVGLKATRDLVPLTPDAGHWHGLSHAGVLTRTITDTALLLDVLADGSPGLAAAVDRPLPALRIGWTDRAGSPGRLEPEVRRALRSTLDLLMGLGHQVSRHDPAYGELAHVFTPRYLRGARDELVRLVEPAVTERRTRAVGTLGRLVPDRVLARAHRDGAKAVGRLAADLADLDVLVLPTIPHRPDRVGRGRARGTAATLAAAGRFIGYVSPWNVTGAPALSVPAGFDSDGLPLAVQLVGAAGDEGLLLALGAQLERERDWAGHRPALD
ncbi:MAG: amidase family protein [Actinomycetota bacterium]|nr:amidase family protein [Actinomycetota bacterium]